MAKIIPFPGLIRIGQVFPIDDSDVEKELFPPQETLWSKTVEVVRGEVYENEKKIRRQ